MKKKQTLLFRDISQEKFDAIKLLKNFEAAIIEENLPKIKEAQSKASMTILKENKNEFKNLFHYAINRRNKEILLFLLTIPEIKALINEGNKTGEKPLHFALSINANTISILINNGANISLLGASKKTTMHYAVEARNLDVITYLKEKENEQCHKYDKEFRLPIHCLFNFKNRKALTRTLTSTYINTYIKTLSDIFKLLQPEVTEAEVKSGTRVKKCLFHYFAKMATQQQMDTLFCRLWPNSSQAEGEKKIIDLFFKADSWGKTPLHIASDFGNADFLEFVSKKVKKHKLTEAFKNSINKTDKKNKTAIQLAMKHVLKKCKTFHLGNFSDHLNVVKILKENGAKDINDGRNKIVDVNGQRPLKKRRIEKKEKQKETKGENYFSHTDEGRGLEKKLKYQKSQRTRKWEPWTSRFKLISPSKLRRSLEPPPSPPKRQPNSRMMSISSILNPQEP